MAKNSECDEKRSSLKRNKENINLDSEERNILTKLKSLPPTNELLQYYQETLSKYEKEDEYLLQRLLSLSQILDNSDRLRAELDNRDRFISELQQRYNQSQEDLMNERRKKKPEAETDRRKMGRFTERDTSRSRPNSNTKSSDDKSQASHLQDQILRQEQIHREEICREREIRHAMEADMRQSIVNHHCRIEHLEETICCLRGEIEKVTRTVIKEREGHRKTETAWLKDRTKMSRKLCYYEKYGRVEDCEGLAQHTSDRLPSRVADEKVLRTEVTKMKEIVKEKEELISDLKFELGHMAQDNLSMKKEITNLTSCIDKLKEKTNKQIEILNDRNDKIEIRRRQQIKGYETDIEMLKKNIKNLENKIIALTSSKQQEKENAKILEDIRDELKKKDKSCKKPEWVN